MAYTIDDIRDRRMIQLGSNPSVDLTTAGVYKIFTTGPPANPAPSKKTIIYAVLLTPNAPKQKWDTGSCLFSIDNTAWVVSQELNLYFVPASIFPAGQAPANQVSPYPNNYAFNFNLTVGNARNGVATASAWGWAW